MKFSDLSTVNAILNSITTLLLLVGFVAIRKKNIDLHKKLMGSAFLVSILFLVSYLVYHYQVGSVKFQGIGIIRTVYFTILITHTILAVFVPPLAIAAIWAALKGKIERHKKIVKWTFPIWIYVSFTGVVIYLMLYHL